MIDFFDRLYASVRDAHVSSPGATLFINRNFHHPSPACIENSRRIRKEVSQPGRTCPSRLERWETLRRLTDMAQCRYVFVLQHASLLPLDLSQKSATITPFGLPYQKQPSPPTPPFRSFVAHHPWYPFALRLRVKLSSCLCVCVSVFLLHSLPFFFVSLCCVVVVPLLMAWFY